MTLDAPLPRADKRTATRIETITAANAGRRLDNVLLTLIKRAPRSLVYKLLRSGQVRVNGGRVKPDYRVLTGDRVRIPPVTDNSADAGHIPASRLAQLDAAIIDENAHFIILNKPAGLACHGGSGLRYGVIEIMRALRPEATRLDLAHRLDRETSGCLVLTKDVVTLREFHAALRQRETCKQYLALLRGRVPDELSRIDAALEIHREPEGERRARVAESGKSAATVIESRQTCGAHTLVTLRLETGRMHQIRAHAQYIGHPIAGDRDYGDEAFNREMKHYGLKRLFLHAQRIAAAKPELNLDAEVPLAPELETVLTKIRNAR